MMKASPRPQICPQLRGDQELKVKVHVHVRNTSKNPEIRKFRMNRSDITFSVLESKILQMCSSRLQEMIPTNTQPRGKCIDIKYKDEDGDMVLFSSDEELSIALEECAANGKFTVFVEENNNYGFGY